MTIIKMTNVMHRISSILKYRVSDGEQYRSKLCRFIALHLPSRLIYFVIIRAGAQCSTAKNKHVPDISWIDMAKHYERKCY